MPPRRRHHRIRPSSGTGTYPRTWRVNEVVRQVVAEELERLADADERLRLLTVTSVEVAGDLRSATVFVGHMGTEVEEALDERRAQLQRTLGREVRLKRTPRLHFAEDPAVTAGERMEEVLRRLARARQTDGRSGGSEGGEAT